AIVGEFAVHGIDTDRVVIAGEENLLSPAVLHELERICERRHMELSFLPRLIGMTAGSLAEAPVAAVEPKFEPAFALSAYLRFKRWIDLFASLALLVLLLPILLIGGVLVLVDVGAPVLFWQERVGWKGRSFLIYKFRTLGAPFDDAGNPTIVG